MYNYDYVLQVYKKTKTQDCPSWNLFKDPLDYSYLWFGLDYLLPNVQYFIWTFNELNKNVKPIYKDAFQ